MSTHDRRFVLGLALAVVVLAALPGLIIALTAPTGSTYVGQVYNTDDHMVYAAWMRQAMDGRFLFDNRFTTDPQPGLTIHLYFFILGLIAKVTGIAFATNLARLVFSFLFVLLLHRLVSKIGLDAFARRLGTALPLVAGGVGFLVWHTFGQAIVTPSPFGELMLGKLPVDVWQPEVFVFPSMLSNGLFMISLCLIALVFLAVLECREDKRTVLWGAGAMFLLMNIHSYDVLMVALVLVGFLACTVVQKQLTKEWLVRAVLIGVGAIPAALWFVYVLKNDPVFQARASTETFSPNFRQVFFGLLLPLGLAFVWFATRKTEDPLERKRWNRGMGLLALIVLAFFVTAAGHQNGYFVTMGGWIPMFAFAVVASALLSDRNPATNLIISWAVVGMVAIYFPALFQRKLGMGLAVPWSVLAAMGLANVLRTQDASARRLVTALSLLLLGATSLRWIGREFLLASANVSNTTLHPVYLDQDVQRILTYLSEQAGRKVLIALPGEWSPVFSANKQEEAPKSELAPAMPDYNPIASGLTGVYSYAGHWSETPNYMKRRNEVSKLFLTQMSSDERKAAVKKTGAQYILSPNPAHIQGVADLSSLGDVVVDGEKFRLIKVR
ncbi:MAG: hypothetical protein ACAH95_09685 [Fimbriimonas sp.]